MTFFESIKTVFRKYADFTGRATLPEFWWFALFSALVSGALGSLNISTGASNYMMTPGPGAVTTVYFGASLVSLWSFAVLLPSLAVTVRRLRDGGNDWKNVLWILLPIAGLIILIIRLCDPSKTETAAIAAPAAPAAPVA